MKTQDPTLKIHVCIFDAEGVGDNFNVRLLFGNGVETNLAKHQFFTVRVFEEKLSNQKKTEIENRNENAKN